MVFQTDSSLITFIVLDTIAYRQKIDCYSDDIISTQHN